MVALLTMFIGGVGCKGQSDQVSVTLSINTDEISAPTPPAPNDSLGISFGQSSSALSYTDVSAIRINITDNTNSNPLYVNFDLFKSAGVWTGTIPFLPKNRSLTFTAHALDSSRAEIFSGTTVQSLSIDNQNVSIVLSPTNDGRTISLPRIKKILVPNQFISGQGNNISFFIEANTGEQISYSLSAAANGGSFLPVNGSITLTGIAGTFVSQYNPPTVTVATDFTHTVTVTNSAGHSVSTTFSTHVLPPGATQGAQDTTVSVVFNPVINKIDATRILGTGNVLWTATVADDGPQTELTYQWTFTPNGTFTPAPAFTGDTNPTTLQNYTTDVQGLIELAVTDAQGGTTTLKYPLTPNQFPDNPTQVGSATGFNAIRAGNNHTCILMNNGTVRCWGLNSVGQLGYGNTFNIGDDANEFPYTAGDVAIVGTAARLAVGGDHTCVLFNDGFVRCWGLNNYGQLGYNTTENIGDGEAIASFGYVNLGGNAVKLAAGNEHTCALMYTGKVRCWGRNNYGQLGYGHTNNIGDNEAPFTAGDVSVGGTVTDITAGANHTCALLDTGKVRCWGRNDFGQLGYANTTPVGDTGAHPIANDINLGGTAIQISAGDNHTCALLDTGNIRCWGYNYWGQLGYGNAGVTQVNTNFYNVGDNETPASVGDVNVGARVLQVTTGGSHTCALLSTGSVKCWGYNGLGELGYGTTVNTSSYTPAPPTGTVDLSGTTAYQVSAGTEHTCALLSSGAARCWGYNRYGQLGYGSTTNVGDHGLPSAAGDIKVFAPAP